MADTRKQVEEKLAQQSEEVRRVISEVFNIEKSRLYQRHPRGLGPEVARAIKDIIE
jgi:hypothetical protein